MKISFFMRHAGYVRNFEPTIRASIQRGHRVDVVFDRRGNPDPEALDRYVENLANEMPHWTQAPRAGRAGCRARVEANVIFLT